MKGKKMRVNFWSEAEDNLLKELHSQGLSMSEIANKLNRRFGNYRTKNSVIGRASRINLPVRPHIIREKPEKVSYAEVAKAAQNVIILPRKRAFEEGITILDLHSHSCRYMTGERVYCGKEIHKGSYCSAHHKLCYVGVHPRKQSV